MRSNNNSSITSEIYPAQFSLGIGNKVTKSRERETFAIRRRSVSEYKADTRGYRRGGVRPWDVIVLPRNWQRRARGQRNYQVGREKALMRVRSLILYTLWAKPPPPDSLRLSFCQRERENVVRGAQFYRLIRARTIVSPNLNFYTTVAAAGEAGEGGCCAAIKRVHLTRFYCNQWAHHIPTSYRRGGFIVLLMVYPLSLSATCIYLREFFWVIFFYLWCIIIFLFLYMFQVCTCWTASLEARLRVWIID